MWSLMSLNTTALAVGAPFVVAVGLWQFEAHHPLYFVGLQAIGAALLLGLWAGGRGPLQQFCQRVEDRLGTVDRASTALPLDRLWRQLDAALPSTATPARRHDANLWAEDPMLHHVLNHLSTSVMLADEQGTVRFINHTAARVFGAMESELNRQLGGFQAHRIVGQSFDRFHRNADGLHQLVANLHGVHRGKVVLGKSNFEIVVGPLSHNGQRLGTVLEWVDHTLRDTLGTALHNTSDLSRAAQSNANAAVTANQLAKHATTQANEGVQVLASAAQTMDAISHSSREVAAITEKIDAIALRTKLLALNAAVEAARTGEHGRGFAVVASEVGALAQQSTQAAKEIRQIVGESLRLSRDGNQWVAHSDEVLKKILQAVQELSGTVGTIAGDSEQQLTGIAEVHQIIDKVSDLLAKRA